jgi:hypothetical protein
MFFCFLNYLKKRSCCRPFCSSNKASYTYDELMKFTLPQLRVIARENRLNLRGFKTKPEIVRLISNFFISKEQTKLEEESLAPVLMSTNLPVLVDSESRICVSNWFTLLGLRFDRIKKSKRFREMQNALFNVKGIPIDESLVENSEGIFMHKLLALFVASFTNQYLLVDVYEHYMISKDAEILSLKMDVERLSNENQILEFESKLKRVTQTWNTFDNIKHAFYVFSIDDILTIGAVGLPKTENPSENSLDKRLASHRNTYAKLKLICVVIFTTPEMLELFESSIKQVLSYCNIANTTNSKLEQYSCDTNVMLDIVSQHISYMRLDKRKLVTFCEKEIIDAYNKKVEEKFGI